MALKNSDTVKAKRRKPVIALALGSGAARGWAHIGAIAELAEMGIEPDIVTGSSVGALVAAAFASGHMEEFEQWVTGLGRLDIVRLLDPKMTGGGFLQGDSLMDAIANRIGNPDIEELDKPFGCVATDLHTGREVWLREGSLLEACRSSIALPGLFTPSPMPDGRLLVDGGLVNPVPVSLARAMGADVVIAVNLNGDLVGHHFFAHSPSGAGTESGGESGDDQDEGGDDGEESVVARWAERVRDSLATGLGTRLDAYISSLRSDETPEPGLFDVIVGSIDIMQDRITRSRMAGEPPDIHIAPRLSQLGLMDFDQAGPAIEEGRRATRTQSSEIEALLGAG